MLLTSYALMILYLSLNVTDVITKHPLKVSANFSIKLKRTKKSKNEKRLQFLKLF